MKNCIKNGQLNLIIRVPTIRCVYNYSRLNTTTFSKSKVQKLLVAHLAGKLSALY